MVTMRLLMKRMKPGIFSYRIIPHVRPFIFSAMAGMLLLPFIFSSCEEFKHPEQDLIVESREMYKNWEQYRSAEMGLYSLQQNLVEQLVVLGELRGDLLKITENATPELVEVYNFNVGKDNPYASPVNFYKLISACNSLIQQLESAYPDVLDESQPVNNYDRLYGEALCMRAWAYFNAVRIYGKVPYIHESLNSVDEIQEYVNSGAEFIDSEFIEFAADGYHNDTIRDTTIVLERKFLNQKAVIDSFTYQLENRIKAVGVDHSINNGDLTWLTTVWNDYARHVLLGKMYLFDGNYVKAIEHFDPILYDYSSQTSDIKFGLDSRFANGSWGNIFEGIRPYEHILTLWFGKSYKQSHRIQNMLSVVPPNEYMMKPTPTCIRYWESTWDEPVVELDYDDPEKTWVRDPGTPGDFHRGYGVSYKYYKDGKALGNDTVRAMLQKKLQGNLIDVQVMMSGVDTVAAKYSIGKDEFAHDAHFIVYRAAEVHLYAAEIYANWAFDHSGIVRPETNTSLNILNDGRYAGRDDQLGVRGRVGFADGYEAVSIDDVIYIHDPLTNKIIDYINFAGDLARKQEYLVDKILEEKAREMAFEGERFYDLIRIAKRRNDPSYLADKVANKFSSEKRATIRNKLLDPDNWYISYFD